MLVFVLLGRYSWKPSKKFIIWQKLWMLQKSRSCLLPWSIYNLSKYSQYSAEFQCCLLYTNIATSTVFYLTLPYMIVLPTSLIVMRNKPSKGVTYVQILNFKPCRFSYWGRSHVAVRISLLYLYFYSLSLSQFQSIFGPFVAISAALFRCFKAMFGLS